MRFERLQDWLDWLERLHPRAIDLGLDRVSRVWSRMRPGGLGESRVITVAGTNGKGSCIAMLEAILGSAGYSTGCYTSPHLLRYNERIRVNGRSVEDGSICAAFERVDRARGDVSLTYFEFGTLAALEIFAEQGPEIALLEVGLGGRLDAVNIVDSDIPVITTVDLDHTDWLGADRETIALEKDSPEHGPSLKSCITKTGHAIKCTAVKARKAVETCPAETCGTAENRRVKTYIPLEYNLHMSGLIPRRRKKNIALESA